MKKMLKSFNIKKNKKEHTFLIRVKKEPDTVQSYYMGIEEGRAQFLVLPLEAKKYSSKEKAEREIKKINKLDWNKDIRLEVFPVHKEKLRFFDARVIGGYFIEELLVKL